MEAHYNQFIGLYPKAVSPETCNKIINYFEEMVEIHKNYNRQDTEGLTTTVKKDDSINSVIPRAFSDNPSLVYTNQDPCAQVVMDTLAECFNHYIAQHDILVGMQMATFYHKVQKTLPSGGYHVWHCEQGGGNHLRRILVYTLYLNDVAEGGETEFLYQSARYPARKGDICVFPAHFTHPHRGNPPLSGEKYIMTGWLESSEIPK